MSTSAHAYLCAKRNTHSRSLDIADDERVAFFIVLVGSQIAEYLRTAVTDGRLGGSIQIGQFWSLARLVRGVPYGGCRRPGHRAGRRGADRVGVGEGVKPARRWPAGGKHRRRCSPARAPGYGSSARRRGFPPSRDGVVTAAQSEGAAGRCLVRRLAPSGELGASRHSEFSDTPSSATWPKSASQWMSPRLAERPM